MKVIYGGKLEMLGDDRIRRWPSKTKEKRGLRVEIFTWKGHGGKHVSVHIEEEYNQWWSEAENAWVELAADSDKRGYSMTADCMTEEEAIAVARHFTEIITGPRRLRHRVTWSGPGRPRWAGR